MNDLRERLADALYEAFGRDIARVNFEHAADALMPIVREAVREAAEEVAESSEAGGLVLPSEIDDIVRRVCG